MTCLASVSYPQLARLYANQQLLLAQQQLAQLLQRAYQQSIISQRILSVCPLATSGCGNNWQKGIQIIDEKQHQIAYYILPATVYITGPSYQLRFTPYPILNFSNATFTLCNSLNQAYQLILNRQGRIRQNNQFTGTTCQRQ